MLCRHAESLGQIAREELLVSKLREQAHIGGIGFGEHRQHGISKAEIPGAENFAVGVPSRAMAKLLSVVRGLFEREG